MGCYSVSCGVSGRAMYGDKAVLIPLVPSKYRRGADGKCDLTGTYLVSNEGPKMFWQPLTLPISGNLDSYGRLENITKDVNTEAIEKMFGMSIGKFCSVFTDGWRDKEKAKGEGEDEEDRYLTPAQLLRITSGMYVHQDIYTPLSQTVIGEYGENSSNANALDNTDKVLKMIGFKFIKSEKPKLKVKPGQDPWDAEKTLSFEEQEKRRYHNLWQNDLFPEIKIWSDGTWVRVQYNDGKYEGGIYHPNTLIEWIEKQTKREYSQKIKDSLTETPYYGVLFDAALDELVKAKEVQKMWEESSTLLDKKESEKKSYLSPRAMALHSAENARMALNLWDFSSAEGVMHFLDLYGSVLNDIKPQQIAIKNFDRNMWSINKIYGPTFCGPQHGNLKAEIFLNQITKAVLDKELEREEEQEREEAEWEKKYEAEEAAKKAKKAKKAAKARKAKKKVVKTK